MADVFNGLSSFFRTPEIAQIAAQSVQAADQATRQGLASIQRDAVRREYQVNDLDASQGAERVGQRLTPQERQDERRRRSPASPAPGKGPAAWPPHKLDITV
jgi:hypothetical protein